MFAIYSINSKDSARFEVLQTKASINLINLVGVWGWSLEMSTGVYSIVRNCLHICIIPLCVSIKYYDLTLAGMTETGIYPVNVSE